MSRAYLTTSWDDGHPLDFRVAELLQKFGLTGTFYIPRSAPTGTMSAAMVRDLASTFEIGAHTLQHVFLTEVPLERAEHEISASKTWVEQTTGQACNLFCPPGGRFTRRHLDLIRAAGYSAVRTVEMMSLDFPRRAGGLLLLPTTIQARPHRPMAYLKKFARRRAARNFWLYLLRAPQARWDRKVRSLLQTTLNEGGVFHLWGHSWEIEQMGQWPRLEAVFRMMSQFSAQLPCLTNGQLCQRMLQTKSSTPFLAAR
jgi:peptidoglycan/xylan/chitin deacetylase (PgdA/CDA1 family)